MNSSTEAPLPEDFFCPLCGSNCCVWVLYTSPAGKRTRMPWLSCAGCTVMFQDAERFSIMLRKTYTPSSDGQQPRVEEVQQLGVDARPLPGWQAALKRDGSNAYRPVKAIGGGLQPALLEVPPGVPVRRKGLPDSNDR